MYHFRQLLECQICHVLVGHVGHVTNISGPGNDCPSLLWSLQTYTWCTASRVLCQGLGHTARVVIALYHGPVLLPCATVKGKRKSVTLTEDSMTDFIKGRVGVR